MHDPPGTSVHAREPRKVHDRGREFFLRHPCTQPDGRPERSERPIASRDRAVHAPRVDHGATPSFNGHRCPGEGRSRPDPGSICNRRSVTFCDIGGRNLQHACFVLELRCTARTPRSVAPVETPPPMVACGTNHQESVAHEVFNGRHGLATCRACHAGRGRRFRGWREVPQRLPALLGRVFRHRCRLARGCLTTVPCACPSSVSR